MTENPIKKKLNEQDRKYWFGGTAIILGFIGSILWTGMILLASPIVVVMLRANDRHAGDSWLPYMATVLIYAFFPWIGLMIFVIVKVINNKKKQNEST